LVLVLVFAGSAFLFWRYVWFFRNPYRAVPPGENIVSPADGTVVYVKHQVGNEEVVVIKQGLSARIEDIVREDVASGKTLIGIFMSPFDVHYNRAPMAGKVARVTHYPGRTANLHMGPMHIRTLFNRRPLYKNSVHIVENERTVTRITGRFRGLDVSCHVVQIAGKSVNGIDSYIPPGGEVAKGQIFGMIRIGSQVDLVFPHLEGTSTKVNPGDKVLAGESILLE
jgi:phosphatidylserine decarboxylase